MRLSDCDIELALDAGRIEIAPRPDASKIKGISVDLRLGYAFRVFADHTAGFVDLSAKKKPIYSKH